MGMLSIDRRRWQHRQLLWSATMNAHPKPSQFIASVDPIFDVIMTSKVLRKLDLDDPEIARQEQVAFDQPGRPAAIARAVETVQLQSKTSAPLQV